MLASKISLPKRIFLHMYLCFLPDDGRMERPKNAVGQYINEHTEFECCVCVCVCFSRYWLTSTTALCGLKINRHILLCPMCTREITSAQQILAWKSEQKKRFHRPTWHDNITANVKETGHEVVDWIKLVQYNGLWRAVVNTVMNFRIPQSMEHVRTYESINECMYVKRNVCMYIRGWVQKFPAWHTKAAPNGKCCEGYIAPFMVRLMYQYQCVLK